MPDRKIERVRVGSAPDLWLRRDMELRQGAYAIMVVTDDGVTVTPFSVPPGAVAVGLYGPRDA